MTKIRKLKRKKTFRANVNRKRLRDKQRKLPSIPCDEIKKSWEVKKSTRRNLAEMGLAYDPNKILKIPNFKSELTKSVIRSKANNQELPSDDDEEIPEVSAPKVHVVQKLEAEAKAPRERMFRLPNSEVRFITYLMDKYGDDYKAMTRDKKNYYQLTWCQIRAKINTFKGVPEQYAEYLLKKGEIVLDDPVPLEETRRKIAEENVKKYCTPKEPKVTKKLWDVESLDGNESDGKTDNVNETNEDETIDEVKKQWDISEDASTEKLKLFPDDESDDEEEPQLNMTEFKKLTDKLKKTKGEMYKLKKQQNRKRRKV